MLTRNPLHLAAERCLSLLGRYQDGGRTAVAGEVVALEVGLVVAWLMELGLQPAELEFGLIGPMGAWLSERCGERIGGVLNDDFAEAFRGAGRHAARVG